MADIPLTAKTIINNWETLQNDYVDFHSQWKQLSEEEQHIVHEWLDEKGIDNAIIFTLDHYSTWRTLVEKGLIDNNGQFVGDESSDDFNLWMMVINSNTVENGVFIGFPNKRIHPNGMISTTPSSMLYQL